MHFKANIKPLSVNKAWKGRKFKTKDYTNYEKALLLLLPRVKEFPKAPYKLTIQYGMSKASDLDNPNKLLLDILCVKYGFNDNDVFEMHTYKDVVKKGQEYIELKIETCS